MATETAIPVPRLIGTDGLGARFEAVVADGYHVIGPAALLLAAITPHSGSWRRNGSAGRRLVTRIARVHGDHAVRAGDDRVEVELGDLRQVVGEPRDAEQDVAQAVVGGQRSAARIA